MLAASALGVVPLRLRHSLAGRPMQSKETTDLARVTELISSIGSGIVLLDGYAGSGKTTLGHCICCHLGTGMVNLVEADQFLRRKQGRYVDELDFNRLKEAIVAAACRAPIVLLDGMCAREIAERSDVTARFSVYVQRNTSTGLAGDLDILDGEQGCGSDAGLSAFDKEARAYHSRYRPRRDADLIFIRHED